MAQETKYNKIEAGDIEVIGDMDYVSLHSHTTYSYQDGFAMPEAHVVRVKELGMKALALTEHGNVSSHVQLEKHALKHGIKPIFGLEAYTAPPQHSRKWHLTMMAMDLGGYKNLMRAVTRSWTEGFYKWPTVHGDILKDHHEGLIILSGCADSHLACTFLGGKGIEKGSVKAAEQLLKVYKTMLGDRYYLEVQRFPGLERTCELNAKYAEWSSRFDIPLVASSDVHYPLPEQSDMQRILHSAGRGKTVDEADWEYKIKLTYPTSDQEVLDHLVGTGLSKTEAREAVAETARIAERCNVELPKMQRLIYPVGEDDFKPWNSTK